MPQKNRLILKNLDNKDYNNTLSCYLEEGGYETLKKARSLKEKTTQAAKKSSPQQHLREEVKGFRPSRPAAVQAFDRPQLVLCEPRLR
jgi:hypothetical protein